MWVKVAFDPGKGHYELKAVGRVFRDATVTSITPGITANSNYSKGGGFGFGMIFPVTKKVDLLQRVGWYWHWRLRELGQLRCDTRPDGVLVPIKAVFSTVGLEFHPTPKDDVNVYVGEEYTDAYSMLTDTAMATSMPRLAATTRRSKKSW